MATKICEVGIMACEDVQAYVRSCKYMVDEEYANLTDGAFVVLGDLCDDETYMGLKDLNCYQATAPEADTDEVWLVDISAVSNGVICKNNYKIGAKLVDLEVEAGFAARCRKLVKGDKFYLGDGCFDAEPTEGEYATLTAGGETTLTPAAEKADGKLCVKIQAVKPLILGTQVVGNEYICEVM